MPEGGGHGKILVVDDEWDSPIVKSVRWRLEDEGWRVTVVEPDAQWLSRR